jgi:hypothetical protein
MREIRGDVFQGRFHNLIDFKEQHFLGTPNFANNLPSRVVSLNFRDGFASF